MQKGRSEIQTTVSRKSSVELEWWATFEQQACRKDWQGRCHVERGKVYETRTSKRLRGTNAKSDLFRYGASLGFSSNYFTKASFVERPGSNFPRKVAISDSGHSEPGSVCCY